MQLWKAHYKDAKHDAEIELINTEQSDQEAPLFFVLDGMTFKGRSLGDFQLADITQDHKANKNFSLLKWGGHRTGSGYCYNLQRYILEVDIPIHMVEKKNEQEIEGRLHLSITSLEHIPTKPQSQIFCDDSRVYADDVIVKEFSLYVGKECYTSVEKTLDFESLLTDICRRIKDKYYLKCCFTCQWSDYSPYGNGDYGDMLCYCRQKEAYLKVDSKVDYFQNLQEKDADIRQETWLCGEYRVRDKAGGYREFVEI